MHVRVGPVVRPPVPRPAVWMRIRLAAGPRPHALHDVQRDRVLEVVGVVELASLAAVVREAIARAVCRLTAVRTARAAAARIVTAHQSDAVPRLPGSRAG